MEAADHSDWRPPDALIASGAGMLALSVVMLRLLMADDDESFLVAAMAQGAIYALSVWLVLRRPPGRGTLAVILGVAVIARLVALPSPPTLSTDAYRYVWDGHVQAAGFNPYRYVPADPQLGSLRDDAIYPNVDRSEYAIAIYPPIAEMIFLLVSRASETLTAIKAAMLAFDMVTIAAIIGWLKRERLAAERVIIYAWHPLPIWEFAGTGHIDAAAIALMSVSILAASHGWRGTAGAMLAAASLVKPFPLVIGPALWPRWDWRMPAAFIAAVAIAYVPYLGAGWQVLGFLHGYADEELYLDGKGFVVVAALRALGLPSPSGAIFAVFALAVLAAIALGVIFRARSSQVDPSAALLLAAGFLLLTSPHYAWYFAWVLPLLCRAVYVPLLYLSIVSFLLYFVEVQDADENLTPWWWLYLGFAAVAAADLVMRRKLPRTTVLARRIRELVLRRSRPPLGRPTTTPKLARMSTRRQ